MVLKVLNVMSPQSRSVWIEAACLVWVENNAWMTLIQEVWLRGRLLADKRALECFHTHTHCGCLLIVSCEWGWASQFSSWLNTAPCGLLNMSPGIRHLWSNNSRLYNIMSLSFPVKREQHKQASEGEEVYQGTDTCMLPYHAALGKKCSFSLY